MRSGCGGEGKGGGLESGYRSELVRLGRSGMVRAVVHATSSSVTGSCANLLADSGVDT